MHGAHPQRQQVACADEPAHLVGWANTFPTMLHQGQHVLVIVVFAYPPLHGVIILLKLWKRASNTLLATLREKKEETYILVYSQAFEGTEQKHKWELSYTRVLCWKGFHGVDVLCGKWLTQVNVMGKCYIKLTVKILFDAGRMKERLHPGHSEHMPRNGLLIVQHTKICHAEVRF